MLNSLYNEEKKNPIETGAFIAKRISQDIELAARDKGYNVTQFTLALNNASSCPKVCSSLDSMLTKNSLNTSDITNVNKFYLILVMIQLLKFFKFSCTNYIQVMIHHRRRFISFAIQNS